MVHGNEPLAVDVGVVHTLQLPKLLVDVQPTQLERHKLQERQALCKRSGWSFAPFVMETIGAETGTTTEEEKRVVGVGGKALSKKKEDTHEARNGPIK